MATRNPSELPPTPDYTHLERLPDPVDYLEARVHELEDELDTARKRIREERAAKDEAEVARLRGTASADGQGVSL